MNDSSVEPAVIVVAMGAPVTKFTSPMTKEARASEAASDEENH